MRISWQCGHFHEHLRHIFRRLSCRNKQRHDQSLPVTAPAPVAMEPGKEITTPKAVTWWNGLWGWPAVALPLKWGTTGISRYSCNGSDYFERENMGKWWTTWFSDGFWRAPFSDEFMWWTKHVVTHIPFPQVDISWPFWGHSKPYQEWSLCVFGFVTFTGYH